MSGTTTTTTTQQVWLITGCSQGLGYELCQAVLAAGQKLVASSRNPSKTPEVVSEIERLGGAWVQLDVASPHLQDQTKAALAVHGRIDVLVNNAGIGMGGAVEDFNIDQTRSMFETNLFGPLRLIQLLTPYMRAQKGGTIVNISSGSTWRAMPGITLYASSKAALNGLTESLAAELAPFGIRVLLLVPGDMRTAFVSPANIATRLVPLSDAYKGTVADHVCQAVVAMHGKQPTDPAKAAKRVVEMVRGTGAAGETVGSRAGWSRIPIGRDSGAMMREQARLLGDEVEALEPVWGSCDVDE